MKDITRKLSGYLIILTKSAKLIKAAKAIKALKAMKPLITVGTMMLSLLVYGWAFGWIFAVGLVAMIFIHEIGHVIAMSMKGFEVRAPVFIPMLGAVIFAPSTMDREQEAFIGIGGPVLGTIGALIAWLIWAAHPDHPMIWLIMSYIGLVINLFNLVPIRPLDGGRVTQAVGQWFTWVGVAFLLIITLMLKDPGLILIWIIVLMDLDKIPLKRRFRMAVGLNVLMFFMIVIGIGEGSVWIHWFDYVLATVYLSAMSGISRSDKETVAKWEQDMKRDSGSDRPTLPHKRKIKWFVYYVLLIVVLVISLTMQTTSLQPWIEEQEQKQEQANPPLQIG